MIYSAQRLDLFVWCVRLNRLLISFRTHFKSLHFHSFHLFVQSKACIQLANITTYVLSCAVSKLLRIIGEIFVFDRGIADTSL